MNSVFYQSEARAKENELQTAIQGLKSVSAGEENAKKNKHAQLVSADRLRENIQRDTANSKISIASNLNSN